MVKKGENIYKRKDKRWEGRYIRGRKENNKIYYGYVYGYSYKEVKKKLELAKNNLHINRIEMPLSCSCTVDEWSDFWFTILKKRLKQSTFSSYNNKYKCHISPYLGSIQLGILTDRNISEWITLLKKNLKPSSIRVIAQVLRVCLQDAVNTGFLVSNPYKNIQLPRTPLKKVNALNKSDHKRLLSYASEHKNGFSIVLALETGLRIGELSGLKWEDIDFSNKLLYVRRTIQRIQTLNNPSGRKTLIIETKPKSHSSERIIPLSSHMCEVLKRRKEQQNGNFILGGVYPCEPRTISYWFKKVCLSASLPNIGFHTLRHTFATRCLENGVTIATISDLLGHNSPKITMDTYLTSFLSEKRKAINMISMK